MTMENLKCTPAQRELLFHLWKCDNGLASRRHRYGIQQVLDINPLRLYCGLKKFVIKGIIRREEGNGTGKRKRVDYYLSDFGKAEAEKRFGILN